MSSRTFRLNPEAPRFERITFNPEQPLDIEIGAGVGLHAILRSQQFPERQLFAVEKTREKFEKMHRRWENHDRPTNLTPVHASVLDWLPQVVDDGQVDQFFILYPNPYPKEKQANMRFFRMPFFWVVIDKLKPGGLITLATNEKFHYEEALQLASEEYGLTIINQGPVELDRTHFERKYRQRGETCYQFEVQKS